MKLKEYIENLEILIHQNPEYAELDVITAKDEEGNGYEKVYFAPTTGYLNEDEFTQQENFDDLDEEERIVNAVCVN